ncbi:MAG: hypothetical protein LAT62_10255 [Natronospirillum sp.]|uniref:hypothetical protein n=1 Tax=Natronospirillum sp. TaxID=2812955 RepID=UPI0025E38DEA|nr:hypothetical protein [Natronospirillum sp.]MCH8552309.1 hypothetical protein [Natronospirillum sp.]
MTQPHCSELNRFKTYQGAFRLGAGLTGQSRIPEAYRWSDDRIRTDRVQSVARAARAGLVRRLIRRLLAGLGRA